MSDPQIDPSMECSTAGSAQPQRQQQGQQEKERHVRSPRFTKWVAFLVFSTITLGSSVEVKRDQGGDSTSGARYAVACSAVTFVITLAVLAMHLNPLGYVLIVGTIIEGVLCIVLTALWVAIVAVVTDSENKLGVVNPLDAEYQQEQTLYDGQSAQLSEVLNGNLYYFSWAGFLTSIILLVSYLRDVFGVDVVGEVRNRAARLTLWAGMLASSLVVTGASSRKYSSNCSPMDVYGDEYCSRTKFAVSVGVLGLLSSIAVVAMKILTSSAPFPAEFGASVFLAVMNAFGVAYTTSSKGPGSAIGNLYYFSWASFLCSLMLSADCCNQLSDGGGGGINQNAAAAAAAAAEDDFILTGDNHVIDTTNLNHAGQIVGGSNASNGVGVGKPDENISKPPSGQSYTSSVPVNGLEIGGNA